MLPVLPGRSFPIGACVSDSGVNFSVYSKASRGLELLLFDHPDAEQPSQVIAFDPKTNRAFH